MRENSGKARSGEWLIAEFVAPFLREHETIRTLNQLRNRTYFSRQGASRPFEGWFHTMLSVRIEEAGMQILNDEAGARACGVDGHTTTWYPDLWIDKGEHLDRRLAVFLKTQMREPRKCQDDIQRMTHLVRHHDSAGVFVCVALCPEVEHAKKTESFDREVERKSKAWQCNTEQSDLPSWARILWRGQDR